MSRILRHLKLNRIRHLEPAPVVQRYEHDAPRTNGKAERFIQTALREWAYAQTYQNSEQRSQQLRAWLHTYNWHRPHTSLNQHPPSAALALIGITC